MNNLINVDNLKISFKNKNETIPVVHDVGFQIRSHEIVGLIGESGSGKSLTALSLLKLLPKGGQITSGSIRFEDKDLVHLPEKEMQKIRGNHIAMIFQDPLSALNPTLSIGYQIGESLHQHERFPENEIKKRTLELLKQVGISDPEMRIHQYPHELSGGMRQRVLIAIALACNPILLIADEPTTALDVTIQLQILDLLQKIRIERKLSILLITHDLGVVAHLCDRVLVMHKGTIIEDQPVRELFKAPIHPYTQSLINAAK